MGSEQQISKIIGVLSDLRKLDDIFDTYVVTSSGNRYSVPGLAPRIQNLGLLTLLNSTMLTVLGLLNRLFVYKAERVVLELQDLLVLVYAINANTALVCVVPNLANVGLLEVEIENSRRLLKEILG